MSSPVHDIFSDSPNPVVTLRRDREGPLASSHDYVPLMVPARRVRLITDSALARLCLFAGCSSVWVVVAFELLYGAR